ncbi:ABC transporter ATP-binding protein [Candidatus Curtissbacteria bacterium]|nr:ABC transporter ATP-binding protein [Candidatus Curtissbacteria bacterium]
MTAIITTKKLVKIYGEKPNQTVALKEVSLEIKRGEFVAIVGPSGSGKSTLMHILGCLDKPISGQYFFKGQRVSKLTQDKLAQIRNQEIGFVFQTFNLLPRTSAAKNVQLPLIYAGVGKKEREIKATKLLVKVGLEDKLQSMPNQLSGGQQQRVAIARALVNNPSIIFADEPTGNLDSQSSLEIMNIFRKLNNQGNTIVIITHEATIANFAKRIITIRDGQIEKDKKNQRRNKKVIFNPNF